MTTTYRSIFQLMVFPFLFAVPAFATPLPQLDVTCLAGQQEVSTTVTLSRDDEDSSYFNTGDGPDPEFVDIIQSETATAGIYVRLKSERTGYRLTSFYARVIDPSLPQSEALGGMHFAQTRFLLIPGEAVYAEVVRDQSLSSDSAFSSCRIVLRTQAPVAKEPQ